MPSPPSVAVADIGRGQVYKEVMSVTISSPECRECGHVFVDDSPHAPIEEKKLCPECGSTARIIGITIVD